MKCPKCGRFVTNVVFTETADHEVKKVEGTCKVHGEVDIKKDWDYDSVHPQSPEECERKNWP